ncbi:LytS/YhcK type 5TM receptor domain-containing protein [Dysosmobacter sp.]|uniref:LytS/YhcK type 5TM receptor domain-containing protein n=1 Tax=Dysosmobacter sp. TaxID=2591382 RepID=UPI002A8739D2|nr:LytS/YhcK type 5TM receptor domain-containing protein [Dysosmobacter sp.]MDY3282743.1 LytS/YhcK type 5TM receptor domain-containing protein [Dysosmobacter sp.]
MQNNLFIYLLLNISLLLLVASVLTELRPLRQMLKAHGRSRAAQFSLGLIFGLLSICCTYTGLEYQGAVVNTRVISTVAAGLVGGPLSGVMAGLISGVHRYFYHPGSFTALACGVGTFTFGLIGAAYSRWFSHHRRSSAALVGIVVFAEGVQALLILVLAKPFAAAVALEKAILIPKILVNSVGLVVFMRTLDRLNRNLSIEMVEQQALALLVAQKCLPYLREGLGNRQALQQAADTVHSMLPDFQVAITNRDTVLAASGAAVTTLPAPARQALEQGTLTMLPDYPGEAGNSIPAGSALIAAPLVWNEATVGTLILIIPAGQSLMLEAHGRTAESLAQLFSSMLELGEFQHQINLRQQAEFRALQSQINPHFLFNALNTISALCLTDPDRARETILVLANYFRQTLSINEPFVTLQQELSNVDNYLLLTEARFEDAIHVTRELPADLTRLKLPPLILQPIVENAVRHGGTAVDDRRVAIRIRQDAERAYISVTDQGHGFPEQVLQKLQDPDDPTYTGLFNVRKRLRSIYGSQCDFRIDSSESGSTVSFSIPLTPPRETLAL